MSLLCSLSLLLLTPLHSSLLPLFLILPWVLSTSPTCTIGVHRCGLESLLGLSPRGHWIPSKNGAPEASFLPHRLLRHLISHPIPTCMSVLLSQSLLPTYLGLHALHIIIAHPLVSLDCIGTLMILEPRDLDSFQEVADLAGEGGTRGSVMGSSWNLEIEGTGKTLGSWGQQNLHSRDQWEKWPDTAYRMDGPRWTFGNCLC